MIVRSVPPHTQGHSALAPAQAQAHWSCAAATVCATQLAARRVKFNFSATAPPIELLATGLGSRAATASEAITALTASWSALAVAAAHVPHTVFAMTA